MMHDQTWNILIVDDEEETRDNLYFGIRDIKYKNKKMDLLTAKNSIEAKEILKKKSSIAVIILDVMMETENAGLQFVKYIRDELKNKDIRILLHTGQPGIAPKKEVADEYLIDGYLDKNSSTSEDVYTAVKIALKLYEEQLILKKNPQRDGVQIICDMIEIYLLMIQDDFIHTKDNLIEHNADLMKLENEIQSFFRVEDSKKKLNEGTTELKLLGEGFNYENIIISHNRNYQINFMSKEEIKLNKDNFIKEFKKRLTQFLDFKNIPENLEQKIKQSI